MMAGTRSCLNAANRRKGRGCRGKGIEFILEHEENARRASTGILLILLYTEHFCEADFANRVVTDNEDEKSPSLNEKEA